MFSVWIKCGREAGLKRYEVGEWTRYCYKSLRIAMEQSKAKSGNTGGWITELSEERHSFGFEFFSLPEVGEAIVSELLGRGATRR